MSTERYHPINVVKPSTGLFKTPCRSVAEVASYRDVSGVVVGRQFVHALTLLTFRKPEGACTFVTGGTLPRRPQGLRVEMTIVERRADGFPWPHYGLQEVPYLGKAGTCFLYYGAPTFKVHLMRICKELYCTCTPHLAAPAPPLFLHPHQHFPVTFTIQLQWTSVTVKCSFYNCSNM